MNKIFLIGNLTKDPVFSIVSGGHKVCKYILAVNRSYTASDGSKEVDFFPVTVWGTMAENCNKYLKKGSKVCVSGNMQTKSYETPDGSKRYSSEVSAEEIQFLTKSEVGTDVEEKENVKKEEEKI